MTKIKLKRLEKKLEILEKDLEKCYIEYDIYYYHFLTQNKRKQYEEEIYRLTKIIEVGY